MTAFTVALALLVSVPPSAGEFSGFWEIAKGVLLFTITSLLALLARDNRFVRDKVIDHDTAIYGKNGENGLKRGLKDVTNRVDLIEDRNTAIDAVAAAEKAEYRGPERRHAALQQIVEMVKQDLQRGPP